VVGAAQRVAAPVSHSTSGQLVGSGATVSGAASSGGIVAVTIIGGGAGGPLFRNQPRGFFDDPVPEIDDELTLEMHGVIAALFPIGVFE
jgi:hypothetical protein